MQLFGGACGAELGSRFHFDYFYPAMLTTFAVRRDLSEFSARGSYGISRAALDDRGGDYTALN